MIDPLLDEHVLSDKQNIGIGEFPIRQMRFKDDFRGAFPSVRKICVQIMIVGSFHWLIQNFLILAFFLEFRLNLTL